MSSAAEVPPGARWLRCDVHVHTPLDRTRSFGEEVPAALQKAKTGDEAPLRAIAYRLFDACHAANLDLVVLTVTTASRGTAA